MPKLTSETSNRFALMGFLSAIGVILLHMGAPSMAHSSGGWFHAIIRPMAMAAVPFYFLASGFFLAGHVDEVGWWKREVQKRTKSLLVPFWTWSVVYWCYMVGMQVAKAAKGSSDLYLGYLVSWKVLWGVVGGNLFEPPFFSVLWFVRALFFMVLLSPLFVFLLRKWAIPMLGCLYILYCFNPTGVLADGSWMGLLVSVFPLRGAFWFALGLALRMESVKTCEVSRGVGICLLVIATVACVVRACGFLGSLQIEGLTVPCVLMGLWSVLPNISLMMACFFRSVAFPIYLIHTFVLSLMTIYVSCNFDSILILLSRVVMATMISILMALLLRRLSPKLNNYLFAGRS